MFRQSGKKKIWLAVFLSAVILLASGCTRYTPPGMEESLSQPGQETEVFGAGGKKEKKEMETAEGKMTEIRAGDRQGAKPDAEYGEEPGDRMIEIYDDSWKEDRRREPVKVKGIYLSAYTAGNETMMDEVIDQIDRTQLNAVVIDFKDDNGNITAQIDSPLFQELGVCRPYISDLPGLLARLKEHGIYTIARVVSLRDPRMETARPQWCFQSESGQVLQDKDSMAWLNPCEKEVKEYLAEVGRQAALAGFDEVQFDYIRFPTDSAIQEAAEKAAGERPKTDMITELAGYIYDELLKENIYVSADVFGAIISSSVDAQTVGQDYAALAGELDYICPMIYPSHYGNGNFGLDVPDMHPYDTVLAALKDSEEVLDAALQRQTQENTRTACVRPWLQDFTASWLKEHIPYGDKEVRDQIQAVYDAGYEEWILWSASNRYHYGALLEETEN